MEDNNNDISLNRPIVNNYYTTDANNEQEDDGHSISFSQIWHMLKKHWIAIVVCTLVGLAGGVLYGRLIKKPKYQASANVMVVNTNDDTSGDDQADDKKTDSDIAANLSLAKNLAGVAYGYMTTAEVREAVCKSLATKYDAYDMEKKDSAMETLANQYSVSLATIGSTSSTSIFITVIATTSEKQQSMDVANTIANVTKELSNGSGSVSSLLKNNLIVTEAMTATDSSTSNVVIALIGTLVGLVVGCGYAIIRELTNTKVTSKYELEQLTGVKIIGMIPKYQDEEATQGDDENE